MKSSAARSSSSKAPRQLAAGADESPLQAQVAQLVREMNQGEGVRSRDIIERVGGSPKRAKYAIAGALARKMIRIEGRSRSTRYFPASAQ